MKVASCLGLPLLRKRFMTFSTCTLPILFFIWSLQSIMLKWTSMYLSQFVCLGSCFYKQLHEQQHQNLLEDFGYVARRVKGISIVLLKPLIQTGKGQKQFDMMVKDSVSVCIVLCIELIHQSTTKVKGITKSLSNT